MGARYYSGFGRPLCPAQIYYRLAAIQCEIYLYDSLRHCSQFVVAPNTISKFSLLSTLQSSLYGTAHSQHAYVCTPLTSKASGHPIASSLENTPLVSVCLR